MYVFVHTCMPVSMYVCIYLIMNEGTGSGFIIKIYIFVIILYQEFEIDFHRCKFKNKTVFQPSLIEIV